MGAIIIIIIIAFLLFGYFNGKEKLKERTLNEGGMKEKYSLLYHHFIEDYNLIVLTETKMIFIKSMDDEWIKWSIKQHYSNYATIDWETNTDGFYKNHLQWQFKDYSDQERVLIEIHQAMLQNLKDYN